MKKIFTLAILLCIVSLCINAQNPEDLVSKKASALSRNYLRPSLTKIYIIDGTANARKVVESLATVKDEKFDYNPVKNNLFTMAEIPSDNKLREVAVKSFIENLMQEEKISNQIVHTWFPTDPEGNLSEEVLMERGAHAATDNDVKHSNAVKRNTELNELGEQLVDRSYIIAYVIKNNESTTEEGEKKVDFADVFPYVYKLDFSADVRDTFYKTENYSPAGIDSMTFPVKHVMSSKSGHLTSVENASSDYDDIMYITRKVADFQVKTPLTATRPIRANIGKKEGVSCDKRFAVMRLVEDKNGVKKAQRVATVRATNKILDNRGLADGEIDLDQQTKFYKIKGRRVAAGETLVENPDLGIGISAEYTLSEAALTIDYRVGKHFGVPGFFVYVKAGIPWSKGLGGMKMLAVDDKGEWKSFQIFDASLGVAKEFNFAGAFAVTPSVEGGLLLAPGAKGGDYTIEGNTLYYTDKSKAYNTKSYKVGAHVKLGYYITRNIQLYVDAGYNYFIQDKVFKDLRQYWAEQRSKRSKFQHFQPISLGAGLKFSF